MREALVAVFEEPPREQPELRHGQGARHPRAALARLGADPQRRRLRSDHELLTPILDLLGLGDSLEPLLLVVAIALGLAANSVLFFAFFRLLAAPEIPARSLWSGALLGAVAFEVLKQLSTFLLKITSQLPDAFQAFGIALILLVWINYFSRVVVYAAAWAYTSAEARAAREAPYGRRTGRSRVRGSTSRRQRVSYGRGSPAASALLHLAEGRLRRGRGPRPSGCWRCSAAVAAEGRSWAFSPARPSGAVVEPHLEAAVSVPVTTRRLWATPRVTPRSERWCSKTF